MIHVKDEDWNALKAHIANTCTCVIGNPLLAKMTQIERDQKAQDGILAPRPDAKLPPDLEAVIGKTEKRQGKQ